MHVVPRLDHFLFADGCMPTGAEWIESYRKSARDGKIIGFWENPDEQIREGDVLFSIEGH